MKNANSFAKQLKCFVKEGNSTYNKSSILKNIKIQKIYSNDKINKKEHYIYFKEQDIKPNGIKKKKYINKNIIHIYIYMNVYMDVQYIY